MDDLTLRISNFYLAAIDNALYFTNKGEDDFVKLTDMRSLTAFTVCMHSRPQSLRFFWSRGRRNGGLW